MGLNLRESNSPIERFDDGCPRNPAPELSAKRTACPVTTLRIPDEGIEFGWYHGFSSLRNRGFFYWIEEAHIG